jgi:hypothetical protein
MRHYKLQQDQARFNILSIGRDRTELRSGWHVVFLLSAVMHEVLVSVPFHMVRPWSFLGMMMQIPLVAATKYIYRRYPGSLLVARAFARS